MTEMKVIYISASSIPSYTANSVQVMKMCQAFVQEGYSINLLTPLWQEKRQTINEDLWGHYGISVRFPITWIPVKGVLGKRLYNLRSVLKARELRADLVYTRNLGAAAISSILGVPTIYEAHDLPKGKMGPRYFRLCLVGRGFRRLVVISQALARLLYQSYSKAMLKKDVIVAHDGVDLERFRDLPSPPEARARLGSNPARFTVGYTGHLYPGRGIELILDLAETFRDLRFLVIGGDEMSVRKWQREAENRCLNNIDFKGFVSNAVLPLYQAACEVLLMPYQRSVAGSGGGNIADFCSPMKMFEYMATGRLIISSDLPVLQEVLNQDNAVLCPPEDIQAWQAAIKRAISDPEWRQQVGQQAKRDVEQYSWRERIKRIMAGL